MHSILHEFPIACPRERVFAALTTPAGLDTWWTASSRGEPAVGNTYDLWFGPEYDWRAEVTQCEPGQSFELRMTDAMPEWLGTRVSFVLEERDGATWMRFAHTGWNDASEHFRITSFCWAMYLRILRRNLEFGETVPYERRLEV